MKIIGVVFLLVLAGCQGPSPAERATYEAIAPAHRRYVEQDPQLDVGQKQARLDLLESWRLRVGGDK